MTHILDNSPLFQAFEAFTDAVEAIPVLPPIVMGVVDDSDGSILSVTLHCPNCGDEDLAEMDWATRWNHLEDPGFGVLPGNTGDLFVSACDNDADFETLAYFCTACGQMLDMSDIEVSWL